MLHCEQTFAKWFVFDEENKTFGEPAVKQAMETIKRLKAEGKIDVQLLVSRFTGHYDAIQETCDQLAMLKLKKFVTDDEMTALSNANAICEPLRRMMLKNEDYGGTLAKGMCTILPWVKRQYARCMQMCFDRKTPAAIEAFIEVYGRNLSSPALLVLVSLLPSYGNSEWSFPQQVVVMNTLMEAATSLGYIPPAELEQGVEADFSQFKSPFKEGKRSREKKGSHMKTRAQMKAEIVQLLTGEMQLSFLNDIVASSKTSEKILGEWHECLLDHRMNICALLLCRSTQVKAASPCVESAFGLRGNVLTPTRSSMHVELTDLLTQRKYLRCNTHQNRPSPVWCLTLHSEFDPSMVLEMEAHRCSHHRVWDRPFEVALGTSQYDAMADSLSVVVWLKEAEESPVSKGWTATVKTPKQASVDGSFIAQDRKWTALGVPDASKEEASIQQQEVHPSMDVWMPRGFYEAMRDQLLLPKAGGTKKKLRKE